MEDVVMVIVFVYLDITVALMELLRAWKKCPVGKQVISAYRTLKERV